MKILDYSEYESLNYYQIKPGRDAGDEESIVYLPENYMPWFLNKKDLFPSKVIFNRYENGLYLGDKKNPYLALVGGEEGEDGLAAVLGPLGPGDESELIKIFC